MAKTKLGNVKGPQGEQGVRGSKWYNTDKITGESTSGTVFPESGIADAMVGDMALNPTTLNLYTCQTAGNAATAKWVFMACIKGPQGPAGPKGDPTTVDAALSESSANPIQNKAVATKFKDVQDSLGRIHKLTLDKEWFSNGTAYAIDYGNRIEVVLSDLVLAKSTASATGAASTPFASGVPSVGGYFAPQVMANQYGQHIRFSIVGGNLSFVYTQLVEPSGRQFYATCVFVRQ